MSQVFLKLLNMSISASWLVLAVLLLRFALKNAPKWVRVLLWGFVAVRLVCPFTIESVLSLIPSAQTVSPQIMMDRTPTISTGISSLDSAVNPIITQLFAPNPLSSANPLQILIPVMGNIWVLGIGAMLLYTGLSYFLLRRKVTTAVLLRDNIFQSEHVPSPFVLGIFHPKIYLPFRLDGKDLTHVVAHEQAHIHRKDHWWKPIGFFLLAVYWFNPLLWLGYILLCRDIELACDEKVIREMDSHSRADYTQALVTCSIHRRSIAACPLAFGEVGVKERVKSVMNYKKPAFWIIVAAIIACSAIAVCFLTDPKTNTNGNISDSLVNQNDGTTQFIATVLEVHDTYLMVAPEPGSPLGNTDQVEVSLAGLEIPSNLQVGEKVLIVYDGYVQEIYPPRIRTAYKIERLYLDSGPVETIYGNVKTYFRNTNGTWQTDGRNYLYRHVLTGRMPNASADSSFIYLSNLEHITFEQAYKAAGYSSNCADWFLVEDAVLVDWEDVAPGGKVENTPIITQLTQITNAKLSWAGYKGGPIVFIEALNRKHLETSIGTQHFPIYVFQNYKRFNDFITSTCRNLSINQAYEEVPAFTDTAANYGEDFFEENALILVYTISANCSYRYTSNSYQIAGEKFTLHITQMIKNLNDNSEEGGWFITVEVPKYQIEDCTQFDAYLLKYTQ